MRRISAPEHGFTVLEVSITSALLMIIVASLLSMLVSSQRSQTYVTARSETMDELRVAMNRLTKEVRQATSIAPTSTATSLDMTTFVATQPVRVQYRLNGWTLERAQGTGAFAPIATRLLTDPPPFTYSPTVTSVHVVTVDLRIRPRNAPDTVVRLTSEIRVRNL